ncbi:hypothetical protein PUNSTDRAFT_53382 [Punctularia strigosozonata HHB-11173 SS5]|uniref:uncharacterized protein n=1 Tax=Punctularia strigosozonata (strain HHB-11173) TaxID=741275 RepID=UPI0004418363|nr:uncharacterized protein PUNSTDRAFT_53382 [Punctularia strigosozonata HHB-11173 SS5]EIN06934.1 hypothetical protein PUNSTDRAFT_53382 [Punctularia strigosozonata HHB-11173 SS5]
MFTTRSQIAILRLAPAVRARLYQSTPPRFRPSDGHDPSLSQGHASLGGNESPQDVLSKNTKSGKDAAHTSGNPVDAASSHRQSQAHREDVGANKEGVGFAEQVGGASAEGSGASHKGGEEASAPGLWSNFKQNLGLGTGPGYLKQNQDGGRGVTGSGTSRKFSTSACTSKDARSSPASSGSASIKDNTAGDQNDHLKHKSMDGEDEGKGNAAPQPTLPSHRTNEGQPSKSVPQYSQDNYSKQNTGSTQP